MPDAGDLKQPMIPHPTGMAKLTFLKNKTRHARSPHPNLLPQAGEGANESLREFQVKRQVGLELFFPPDGKAAG